MQYKLDESATSARRLLLKAKEVCELLGGVHPRTLSRLEKAGHIQSVHLLRHKLYAAEDVESLVQSLRSWNKHVA